MADLGRLVREVCMEHAHAAETPVAVLLSAGVDSQAVLRAFVRARRRPAVLSFTLEDRESRDFRVARATAGAFGLPFFPVRLSTDLRRLEKYVESVIKAGVTGKAAVECFWPRWEAMKLAAGMSVQTIATGDGGDGYFGLSKAAMLRVTRDVEKLDEFRRWYFARPDWAQTATMRAYGERLGIRLCYPLADPRLLPAFMGRSWMELNRPRQKQPIRDSFDLPPLAQHVNLQLGDSGISELFGRLARSLGYSSSVRMFNRLRSGQQMLSLEGGDDER